MKKINPYQKKRPDGTRFPGWYARIPLASGKERRVSLGTKEEHTARSILNDIALLHYRKAQDIQEAPQGLEPTAYTLYFETDTAVYFSLLIVSMVHFWTIRAYRERASGRPQRYS